MECKRKEAYEMPEVEIVLFEKEDIITTSGINDFTDENMDTEFIF